MYDETVPLELSSTFNWVSGSQPEHFNPIAGIPVHQAKLTMVAMMPRKMTQLWLMPVTTKQQPINYLTRSLVAVFSPELLVNTPVCLLITRAVIGPSRCLAVRPSGHTDPAMGFDSRNSVGWKNCFALATISSELSLQLAHATTAVLSETCSDCMIRNCVTAMWVIISPQFELWMKNHLGNASYGAFHLRRVFLYSSQISSTIFIRISKSF